MSWVSVAVGGSALAGGIANYAANSSAEDRQRALQDKQLQSLIGISIPDPAQQKIALQQFVQQGTLTPQLEQAFKQAPSAMQQIQTSSATKSAQNRALQELEQEGSQGGLRLQDKAALQDAQMKGQVADRGNRQAILDDAARRGQGGGSGFALQAALQGQQAAGDRDARSSLSVAADAQNRALQAIEQSGQLAGQQRTQDFGEQAAKAQAADAINRFNTSNAQSVANTNVGLQNQAQQQNLSEKQNIANQNTGLANQEQQYNKGLIQQKYNNQIGMAGAENGVYGQMGQNALAQGQTAGNFASNIGAAGAGAATTLGQQNFWNDYFDKQKKNASGDGTGAMA